MAEEKTDIKKYAPYLLGGAAIIGGIILWQRMARPPVPEVPEFDKLIAAEYWSRINGKEFVGLPGSALPVKEGAEFGGNIQFRHKGPSGIYQVGFWADIEGYEYWAGPGIIEVGEDRDWKTYAIEVSGIIGVRKLGECRNIDTHKEIRTEEGAILLEDPDADCYHVTVTGHHFSNLIVGEYWATNPDGTMTHTPPGGLTPIVHGALFYADVIFKYRGEGGVFNVGFNINVADYREWSRVEVTIPFTPEEEEFIVHTDPGAGTFDSRGLGDSTRLGTRKEIWNKDLTEQYLADDDADCYHLIKGHHFSHLIVGEYYASNTGVISHTPPGGKTPIVEGGLFYGDVKFKYRGEGSEFRAGFSVNVKGIRLWTWGAITLPFSDETKEYTVHTDAFPGIFSSFGLISHCTSVGTRKEIWMVFDEEAETFLWNDDADCYHFVDKANFWMSSECSYNNQPEGTTRISVSPRQTVRAKFTVRHKGVGGRFWVGMGIFPTRPFIHYDPSSLDFGLDIWIGGVAEFGFDLEETDYEIEVFGSFPSGFISGTYDVLRIINRKGDSPIDRGNAGKSPRYNHEFDDDWDDDIFEVI